MQRRILESTPYEGLKNGSHIDVEVYYTKGGPNYWLGGTRKRGYYVSVTPRVHANGTVRTAVMSGVKKLLFETSRFTEKQFCKAVAMGKAEAPKLIAYVLEEERAS